MKVLIAESYSLLKKYSRIILTVFTITMLLNLCVNILYPISNNLITYALLTIIIQLLVTIPLSFGVSKTIYNICNKNITNKMDIFGFYSCPYKITFYILYFFVQLISFIILLPYFFILLTLAMTDLIGILFIWSLMVLPILFFVFFLQAKFSVAFFLFFDIEKTRSSNYIRHTVKLTKSYNKLFLKFALLQFVVVILFMIPIIVFTALSMVYGSIATSMLLAYSILLLIVSVIFEYFTKILKCNIYRRIISENINNKDLANIIQQINDESYFEDFSITDIKI